MISRGSERAVEATRALEALGFKRVAAMLGGIVAADRLVEQAPADRHDAIAADDQRRWIALRNLQRLQFRQRIGDRRQRVAGHRPRVTQAEVDVLVAVDVTEPCARCLVDHDRERSGPTRHPGHRHAAQQVPGRGRGLGGPRMAVDESLFLPLPEAGEAGTVDGGHDTRISPVNRFRQAIHVPRAAMSFDSIVTPSPTTPTVGAARRARRAPRRSGRRRAGGS